MALRKKTHFRKWINNTGLVLATFIIFRWLIFNAITILTPSMENVLLIGDCLFVNRLQIGATTSVRLSQVPLTHQTLFGFSLKSYFDWVQLPKFRLLGFSEIKRNDVLVFKLPVEQEELIPKYRAILSGLCPHPLDQRSYFINRCVGLPGDSLSIEEGEVYINDTVVLISQPLQYEYLVQFSTYINERTLFRDNGVTDYAQLPPSAKEGNTATNYYLKTTVENAKKIKNYSVVKSMNKVILPKFHKQLGVFPSNTTPTWNRDQFGPVWVPRKGVIIKLTPRNTVLYQDIILYQEGHQDLVMKEGRFFKRGMVMEHYRFKQDYYFMLGDNRHSSVDSRYWGFVPKNHIVGKAIFVWMSVDPEPTSFRNKIRWSRIFRVIE